MRLALAAAWPRVSNGRLPWDGTPIADDMTDERAKRAALTKSLRSMFKRLQARPTPERLLSAVGQLESCETPPPRKKADG